MCLTFFAFFFPARRNFFFFARFFFVPMREKLSLPLAKSTSRSFKLRLSLSNSLLGIVFPSVAPT